MSWRTESIQAVAFVTPGVAQPDALKIWQTLFENDSPDSFQRPVGGPAAQSNAMGVRENFNVGIMSQLGRITVNLAGSQASPSQGPPNLPDAGLASKKAAEFLVRVCSLGPVYRVGLAAGMTAQVSAAEAPKFISEMTGSVNFPNGSIDCIYQFNVRRPFESVGDFTMNRVRTWAMGEQQLLTINTNPGSPQATQVFSPVKIESIQIVNCRIDINSATIFGAVIGDHVSGMAEEMRLEMLLLMDIGDQIA